MRSAPLIVFAATLVAAAEPVVVAPTDARIRVRGNFQQQAFSFWTDGLLGDWFIAPQSGKVTLTVTASGRAEDGLGPQLGVERIPPVGEPEPLGMIQLEGGGQRDYTFEFETAAGFCGLQFRHLNRVGGGEPPQLRHLLLSKLTVDGLVLAQRTRSAWWLFSRPAAPLGAAAVDVAAELDLRFDPSTAVWQVRTPDGQQQLRSVRPVLAVRGVPTDLERYRVTSEVTVVEDSPVGPARRLMSRYQRDGALAVDYTLWVSTDRPELAAQVDLVNQSGQPLTVDAIAPLAADVVALPGTPARWTALSDGKPNNEPYHRLQPVAAGELEGWWYLALRDDESHRSLVLGSLTNKRGLGRFVLGAVDGQVQAAAVCDYESIVLPPGDRILGEPQFLHFGRTGSDGLDRLGTLIAKAHDIDLRRDHPIDPDTALGQSLFTTWNGYGSAVVKGFEYHFDHSKGDQAFMDPAWIRANQVEFRELGLTAYGYGVPANTGGTTTPLVRRYGEPDFWSKSLRQIRDEHPEYYVDGRIDFSNPAVVEFERQRVAGAFAGKRQVLRYSWDFTNDWRKLRGQHDSSQTSAQTFRNAMSLWRDAAQQHPEGAYGYVWMNVVGLCYDLVDVIHIGHDSDQGYYGPSGLTFTQGLVRQIAGRAHLNGKVWWNSPDSYHVYVGGLYSLAQARTHASFCSLAGNLVHLGEPFTDETIPRDRLNIIRRVSPTTADVAHPVDLFEHAVPQLWDLPVHREFGDWHVVGLFNVDFDRSGDSLTQTVRFADLGLDPAADYLVYEFWSDRFLGVQQGEFTRTVPGPGCEVYAVVPATDHPTLVSTNRHVRQMALELRALAWDAEQRVLRGESIVVGADPYELRVWLPAGYRTRSAEFDGALATVTTAGAVARVKVTPQASGPVAWSVTFERP